MIEFIFAAIIILLYLTFKPYFYWRRKNVPTGPGMSAFADSWNTTFGSKSIVDMVQGIYYRIPEARYIGSYEFRSPVLFIKCPELVKDICVKDFDYFMHHRNESEGVDELWTRSLLGLKGKDWKNMRHALSPALTRIKVKSLFTLVQNKADSFVQYYSNMNQELQEVEFKGVYTRYCTDVIGSVVFGVEVDSLRDSKNEFFMMGEDATDFTPPWRVFVLFLYMCCPQIAHFFRLSVMGEKVNYYFMDLVKQSIQMRREQKSSRQDLLGILLDVQKGLLKDYTVEEFHEDPSQVIENQVTLQNDSFKLTDSDMAAQMFIFFMAGYETASTTLCFSSYELALNPDVQKKLIKEIDQNKTDDGSTSYETIMNMTYLNMVVCESLRKWPATVVTDRVVTKPYVIAPKLKHEKPVFLDVGDTITIPIYALHHDPQFYLDPEKFNPERFSEENKKNINQHTYLPFGIGPRNCIGFRLALLEVKTILFNLLSQFELVPVEKTDIPLKIGPVGHSMVSETGFTLGLKRRN